MFGAAKASTGKACYRACCKARNKAAGKARCKAAFKVCSLRLVEAELNRNSRNNRKQEAPVPPSERLGRATLSRAYDQNERRDGRTRRSTLGQRLLRKLRTNETSAGVGVKVTNPGSR
jgi:hypothetical protein